MALQAGFDGTDSKADDRDMVKEAGGTIPIVLMDENATLRIETDDCDSEGPDGFAFGNGLELVIHHPAEVIEAVAAARDIVELNGQGDGVLRGAKKIALDIGGTANGLEGVIEPGVGRVDLEGVGSNTVGAPIAEKVFQSVNGQPFGVGSSDDGGFGGLFSEDGAKGGCVIGLARNGLAGDKGQTHDHEQRKRKESPAQFHGLRWMGHGMRASGVAERWRYRASDGAQGRIGLGPKLLGLHS